jgi:formate dehydrogenase subunit delta
MRRKLFEHIDHGGEGLNPLVLEAAPKIRRPEAA